MIITKEEEKCQVSNQEKETFFFSCNQYFFFVAFVAFVFFVFCYFSFFFKLKQYVQEHFICFDTKKHLL